MKLFQENDLTNIKDYKPKSLDSIRIFFFFLIGICTLGIFWFLTYWFEDLLYMLYKNEEDIWKADYILFTRLDGIKVLIKINRKKCRINPFKENSHYLFLSYEGQLFYFSPRKEKFVCVKNQMINYMMNHYKDKRKIMKGLDQNIVDDLIKFYGKNEMEIEVMSFGLKALQEFLTLINFSQFLIAVAFFFLNRVMYSVIVMLFVFITVFLNTFEYIENKSKLKRIAELDDRIYIKRFLGKENISGYFSIKELVIGDVVELEPEKTFPCDMLLVEGSCLVNEALLTGESLPIIKSAYNLESRKVNINNLIFSGTKALLKRTEKVKAIVLGTGWNTSKGKLIGSVVFSPVEDYQFEKDFFIMLFILFLFFFSLMVATFFWDFYHPPFHFSRTLAKLIEYLKNNFPPSLIFIMTASIHLSSKKLGKKEIFTLKSKKILEGGALKYICFDKTGTLTELNLNLKGFIMVDEGKFENYTENLDELFHLKNYKKFLESINCGHALVLYNDKITGDPLEEAMLEKVGGNVQLGNHEYVPDLPVNVITFSDYHKKILKLNDQEKHYNFKTIEFTSERKRMSVISQNSHTKEVKIICKGAPEVLKSICKPNSIPKNYDEILLMFSEQGLRIISIAIKTLRDYRHEKNDSGEKYETDLEFLGFLLFENALKPSTIDTIENLKKNDFDVAMITGDNIYTAINIGYNSGIIAKTNSLWIGTWDKKINWTFVECNKKIIDISLQGNSAMNSLLSSKMKSHEKSMTSDNNIENLLNNMTSNEKIALTGTCFQKLMEKHEKNKKVINLILEKTAIYARSSAKQKELVIKQLKSKLSESESYVAFVGDGSNDSLALKTAHVGLSIGNNESSFSASFFTALTDIASIKHIIIEGKVCLSNALQNFKILMCLNIVNSFTIFYLNFFDYDFIQFDYVTIVLYSFFPVWLLSQSENTDKLTFIKKKPSFLNFEFLFSFFSNVILFICTVIVSTNYLLSFGIKKDVRSVTSTFDDKSFDYNDHYFVECKLIFKSTCLLTFLFTFAFYESFPFKVPLYKNVSWVIYQAFVFFYILINIFPDFFLGFNDSLYRTIKRTTRIPDYDEERRNKFFSFVILVYFVLFVYGQICKIIPLYQNYRKRDEKNQKVIEKDLKLNLNK